MTIHAHTLVAQLVAHHPYCEDVFAWHGVPLDDRHRAMSLYALCWVRGLELQTLLTEIEAAIAAEEEPTEELTADSDAEREVLEARLHELSQRTEQADAQAQERLSALER